MTTSTEAAKPEVTAGHNEEQVTELIGGDLPMLVPVENEGDTPDASTEGLHDGLTGGPVEGCGCHEENNRPMPPCVSRVIDADGKAKISIILGPLERSMHIGTVIGFLDSASENDVVDITIVADYSGQAGTMQQRSILSAIDRCKGHVITRAGALTTLGDVAIWLSGDERNMSPIGMVSIRQPVAGYSGDAADYAERLNNVREAFNEYSNFVVECGMFSKEELDEMYQHRGLISLFGEQLRQRIANLKVID